MLLDEELSYEMLRAPEFRMLHRRGQRQAEQAQAPEDEPPKLFT
ncbi:hypothetical protein [Streptomyces swartbergensis]|nr:hypothetical protein [Streptomyces swartbergensis]